MNLCTKYKYVLYNWLLRAEYETIAQYFLQSVCVYVCVSVCVYACIDVCACVHANEIYSCSRTYSVHSSCLSCIDHLVPQVIHSLKDQSLDVLRLGLSLKSPSTVELFRALPQSRLKEFQLTSADIPMVGLCCSLMWLLPNSLLQFM